MLKKLSIAFSILALAFLLGSSLLLAADCFSSAQCNQMCNDYCTSKHQTCSSASLSGCDSNGQEVCSVLCNGGSGYFPTCTCSTGGGSPIFRKQPSGPPPQSQKSSKSKVKPAQSSDKTGGKCEGSQQPS